MLGNTIEGKGTYHIS